MGFTTFYTPMCLSAMPFFTSFLHVESHSWVLLKHRTATYLLHAVRLTCAHSADAHSEVGVTITLIQMRKRRVRKMLSPAGAPHDPGKV